MFFWLQVTSIFRKQKEFVKGQIFWWRVCYLHGKRLAGRPRTTILLQRNEQLWRNAGPSAFQLQETMLKNMMCVSH